MKIPLTREFLEERIHAPTSEIANESGYSERHVRRKRAEYDLHYRSPPTQKLVAQIMNKKPIQKPTFGTLYDLIEANRKLYGELHYAQEKVLVKVEDPTKWVGVIIYGDQHWGSWWMISEALMEHTELGLQAENVIMVQLGDLISAESSAANRTKTSRNIPEEVPLAAQRHYAKEWFKMVDSKLVAYVIGNHDRRSILTEDYDLGDEIAKEVSAAYLGYGGMLELKFNDDLIYNIYLAHTGDGRSMYHKNHPARRAFREMNYPLDVFLHGHIHTPPAISDEPTFDGMGREIGVLAGGFRLNGSDWERYRNYKGGIIETPIILFSPERKEIHVIRSLEFGLGYLKWLNEND